MLSQKAIRKIRSKVVPLPFKDVDTDMIIPAQFLTSISKEGHGQHLFSRLRQSDPQFPLNQTKYHGAEILVVDSNFGCGSSREHAVWSILDAGIRVVIAKSFADIFASNSVKNGLLLITLPEALVDRLLFAGQSGDYVISVNLEEQKVELPDGEQVSFDFDPFRKHCLLNGLDDIDYILSFKDEIAASKGNVGVK